MLVHNYPLNIFLVQPLLEKSPKLPGGFGSYNEWDIEGQGLCLMVYTFFASFSSPLLHCIHIHSIAVFILNNI